MKSCLSPADRQLTNHSRKLAREVIAAAVQQLRSEQRDERQSVYNWGQSKQSDLDAVNAERDGNTPVFLAELQRELSWEFEQGQQPVVAEVVDRLQQRCSSSDSDITDMEKK